MQNFKLLSPLEQFELSPVFYTAGSFDFPLCFTTASLYMLLIVLVVWFLMFSTRISTIYQVIPNVINAILEIIYNVVLDLVRQNIGEKGRIYFPFVFSIFMFVFASNLAGMFPYSFTITSHIAVTFGLATIVFFGVNFIGIKKHKSEFLTLFLPGGSPLALAPLLVPIELVSYSFRIVSLPVRLFANMMAGHTLLKVIVGFFWSLTAATGVLFLLSVFPFVALVLLIGLELGVAMIQAFVFTILTCVYINDAINLH
jgi:ATP synthase subunit 6